MIVTDDIYYQAQPRFLKCLLSQSGEAPTFDTHSLKVAFYQYCVCDLSLKGTSSIQPSSAQMMSSYCPLWLGPALLGPSLVGPLLSLAVWMLLQAQ